MEDICEWARVLIASAIGGLFPLLGVVLTVKSERKRIVFQSLYADKQILYSKIVERLMQIKEILFSTSSRRKSCYEEELPDYLKELKTHLIKLELIAPKEIITYTRLFIKSIDERTSPIVLGFSEEERTEQRKKHRNELQTLDENLKMQCEKLAELLRKDLGASNKVGL